MNYQKLLSAICLSVFAATVAAHAATAPLPVSEKRVYEILIDRKPAGIYKLTLTDQPDGAVDVQSQADVNYAFLVFHYKYNYKGHEVWREDQLKALDSLSNDDGKSCTVQARQHADGMHVKTNGKDCLTPGPVISSSYWHLPTKAPAALQILEVDSGRLYKASVEKVGDEVLIVGGASEPCQHYKLKGGDRAELWYDSKLRLVRQTSSDDGHKTVIQLKSKSAN